MVKLIILIILTLMLNGCCAIAGFGMKNAREESKTRSDAFHAKVIQAFERAN